MDQKSQERLDNILKKNPEDLTTEEIKFLKARRTYLKKSQLKEYDKILNPVTSQTSQKETVKKHATTK